MNAEIEQRDVADIAVSPSFGSDRLVFAATQTGLLRSTDAGASWEEATDGFDLDDVRAVACSSSFGEDRTVFAGGVLGFMYRSVDGGASWTRLDYEFDGETVSAIEVGPDFANDPAIFVGTVGEGIAAVHRSSDGGQTFERFVEHESTSPWISISVPASFGAENAHWVFATASQVFRPTERFREVWAGSYPASRTSAVLSVTATPTFGEDETLFTATSQGVFRSSNGGAAWEEINFGLQNRAVLKVAVSPTYADDKTVYALALGGEIWRFVDEPATRTIAERKPTDIV